MNEYVRQLGEQQKERMKRLIAMLPSLRRRASDPARWPDWTGELISAMAHAGASDKEVFETFLWEAQVLIEGRLVSLNEAKDAIEQFSLVCAELVVPPQQHRPRRDDLN
jgi:hypothetical protein